MRCPRRTGVAAVALVLLTGCMADELHVGMAPARLVSPPSGNGTSPNYFTTTFGTHWNVIGLEVTANSFHEDIQENIVTVEATLWLGWLLTYQHGSQRPRAWLVLRPSAGMYTWSEAPESVGVTTGIRAGVGVHINEFNTIGLEYGRSLLHGTHGSNEGATEAQGLFYTYTIIF